MTRIAYFDLAHGASGDMIMATLAHAGRRLGIDVEGAIGDAVASVPLSCAVSFVDDERGGIACLRAEVKTDGRTYDPGRLRRAIEDTDITEAARARASRGLEVLVGAEAAVHGRDLDDVHLHELGSADTAADLVGAAAGIAAMGVDVVAAAPVPVPRGWIGSEHGPLPVPAPVTLEVLAGARLRGVDEQGELVTPTAAAVLVGHDALFGEAPDLVLRATGVGAGTRVTDVPNICRVLVGDGEMARIAARSESVVLLETNIDDQSPQGISHAMQTLIAQGALDAWVTPIVMKKSRPAFLISVLVRPSDETRIVSSLFRETTTLGVRRRDTTRWALEREELHVRVGDQTIRVKVARLDGDVVNVAPEFDDCVTASQRSGIAAQAIHSQATEAARRALAALD